MKGMGKTMPRKTLKINVTNDTLKEVMDNFIDNCKVRGLSEYTIENYQSTCNMFLEFVQNKPLEKITTSDIDKYILYLRKRGNTNGSIKTRIKSLKCFFNYAKYDIELPIIKKEPTLIKPYSDEEIKILVKEPKINSYTQWRNHAIFCTLLATGMRCRSLINLKIKDIDFTNNTIYLSITKTKKQYFIPMSYDLKCTLRHYLSLYQHNDDDYLFVTLYGEQMSRNTIKQTMRDYNRDRNINTTGLHRIRHTFAINYLKNGGNIAYLQEILGHSNIQTTKQYLNVTIDDLKASYSDICPLDNVKRKGIKLKGKR